jgi:hypothetical protein
MSGPRIGALIAATAGLAFILVNAGELSEHPALVVRVLGGLAGAAVVVVVLARAEPSVPVPAPPAAAWRTYWLMVVLEVVLLITGSRLLAAHDHTELSAPWVAFIVGLHFLPFAKAFGTPLFRYLGWALITLGAVGAVLALSVGAAAGAVVGGVVSGITLFAFAVRFR